MLDLRRLRLLSELSRRDTIAQVANTVGYTPSAVSQSLAKLERDAGVALLERDGRRVRLTPAARALVTRADRAIAELDAAEAELAEEAGAVRGRIEIGSFPSAALELVLPAIAELGERHSNLTCHVYEHEPEDGIPLLRAGELDLLVTEGYDNIKEAATGGLESQLLVSEPLLLVLPTGHPGREPIPLRSLRDANWIGGLVGTQFAAALEHACRTARVHAAHRAPRGRGPDLPSAGRRGPRRGHAGRAGLHTRSGCPLRPAGETGASPPGLGPPAQRLGPPARTRRDAGGTAPPGRGSGRSSPLTYRRGK
jgi:DNA-binding transcriptional LysR family regulator